MRVCVLFKGLWFIVHIRLEVRVLVCGLMVDSFALQIRDDAGDANTLVGQFVNKVLYMSVATLPRGTQFN